MTAGALALVAMFMTVVAPKSVHAIVATAVQVMNTSATPVPNRDVDAAARNAKVLFCGGSGTCSTSPVPTGFIFVLDSLSVFGSDTGGPVLLSVRTGGVNFEAFIPYQSVGGFAYGSMSLPLYADPGSVITVRTYTYTGAITGNFTGHLVSTP
jgi:hypothetical protein